MGTALSVLAGENEITYITASGAAGDEETPDGQRYSMLILTAEATITFKTTWVTDSAPDGIEFTSKVLPAGNYPRYIYNITIEVGEAWLIK